MSGKCAYDKERDCTEKCVAYLIIERLQDVAVQSAHARASATVHCLRLDKEVKVLGGYREVISK